MFHDAEPDPFSEVMHCLDTAVYLRDEMTKAGIRSRLNDLSCTVVFERPVDEGHPLCLRKQTHLLQYIILMSFSMQISFSDGNWLASRTLLTLL